MLLDNFVNEINETNPNFMAEMSSKIFSSVIMDFSNNKISDFGCTTLFQAFTDHDIHCATVNLSNNLLTDESCQTIVNYLKEKL